MSVYSKRTNRTNKSNKTSKTTQTRVTQHSIRPKLLNEIKSKYGVVQRASSWHIDSSLLQSLETPNPFNKLISKHNQFSDELQSSICSTLSSCLETAIDSKRQKQAEQAPEDQQPQDDDISISAIELFGLFITLLQTKQVQQNQNNNITLIILLSYLLPSIPSNVVLTHFDALSQRLGQCVYAFDASSVTHLIGIEYCSNCMASMLMQRVKHHQKEDNENAARLLWNNEFCQKMLQCLFVLSVDDSNEIRRAALKHIDKLFKLYPTHSLPKTIKNLMRCFIERQIEGLLNNDSSARNVNVDANAKDNGNGNENEDKPMESKPETNVIAFICELLMQTLQYLSLKESSYIISLLFNTISYLMQTYGNNTVQFKHLNLQQMFLKLIYKFIQSLPAKLKANSNKLKQQQDKNDDDHKNNDNENNNNNAIDELAKQLKDKVDLKKLVQEMRLDADLQEDSEADANNARYVSFIVQLYGVIQKFKPPLTDTVGVPIYYNCLVSIIHSLYQFDEEEAVNRSISIITIILNGFESNKKKIVQQASDSIVKILDIIVNDEMIQDAKSKITHDPLAQSPAAMIAFDDPSESMMTDHSEEMLSKRNKKKLPILQRIIILIETLLDFKYKSSWMYVYSLCSALFRILGKDGFCLLCNILTELSELRCMEQVYFKSSLEDCICCAIKHCGPQNILSVIPLNLPDSATLKLITMDKAILKSNLWLIPLLKQNINRTDLAFFGTKLLPIADQMMKQSKAAKQQNMIIHSKQFDNLAHMIWSLFPSFCIYPTDFCSTFPKIAEPIANYLIHIENARMYIIGGFTHLIEKPLRFLKKQENVGSVNEQHVENAKSQIATMANYAQQYLPILCNLLIITPNDHRLPLLKLVALFTEIGDQQYIQQHFQRTMIKCLEDDQNLLKLRLQMMQNLGKKKNSKKLQNADNDDEDKNMDEPDDDDQKQDNKAEDERELEENKTKYEKLLNQETAYLLILNQMVPFIDMSQLEKFWAFLKQQFMKTDQSPLIQKLLYKNLFTILNYQECMLLKDKKQLNNFLQFVIKLNSHGTHKQLCVGAKYWRLNCIHTLLDCLAEYELAHSSFLNDDEEDTHVADNSNKEDDITFTKVYPEFIGELIVNVSLKNLKLRKSSLLIIELIASRLDDISGDLFNKFVLKMLGGLISSTSAMQSATILTLTYLIVQFEMRIPPQILNELLKTVSLRIEEPTNEVIKASLDFIEIVIKEMPDHILNENLMDLLTTLLKWLNTDDSDSGTNSHKISSKFRKKVTKCIDLLLKRFGYERILKLVPNRFKRLIKYLRKRADYIANKKEKKKKLLREQKLMEQKLSKQLDELPPDHPLNVNAMDADNDGSDDDDDGKKQTVFEQMKSERMSVKSGKSNKSRGGKSNAFNDTASVRMKIDGMNDITDLTSTASVKKHLISEYEANRLIAKQEKMSELGMQSVRAPPAKSGKNKKSRDHVYELDDGRLLITDSDTEDEDDHKARHKKKNEWKNLSDDEKDGDDDDDESDSDLSDAFDANDDRDVDDILSQYSKYNKMTQLKKALADVSGAKAKSVKSSKKGAVQSKRDLLLSNKRRKLLESVKNDAWTPGELQPYGYHVISPGIMSKKKKHLRQSTFERVMGKKRSVAVRTDAMHTNSLKISRTRKIGHGRYTLSRSKIKAKQKHLIQDIKAKHRKNQMRRSQSKSRSKSRSKSQSRGKKRRFREV